MANGVDCPPGCHRYAMAHTLDEIRECIRWWQMDFAYKAQEQINRRYVAHMLERIAETAGAEAGTYDG